MLNFDTNIQSVIDTQKTTSRAKAFIEYSSKKSLFESGKLDEDKQTYIMKLKGTFSFHLHIGGRYLIVVFYNAREKQYSFLVVDFETLTCADADSIKNAKKGVLELVGETVEQTVEEATEENTSAETAEETTKKPTPRKSKKTNK